MGPLTLGTAGHIDHGKTALVEALTGKNTDRLEEEHRRGISIELGYARLDLADGCSLSVIDVPGHERLVRTMVAGATGIDLFLMVVAADEGVMPQTREHLTVLRALGVEVGVIALTRCDLAEPGARTSAATEARDLIDASLVEVSARTGEGLDELRLALADAAELADARRSAPKWEEPAVLHVDRVFTLRGIGTVATGTLWSGTVREGERVEVLPEGIELRIRSIQVHDTSLGHADAGQRVALNLTGPDRDRLARGDVICTAGAGLQPTYRLDVELGEAVELRDQERRVQVHHGTRNVPARLVRLDQDRLAQLRLESTLIARAGDRFVLRRLAPAETLGGGTVIDPKPARHGPGPAAVRLRQMTSAAPEELISLGIEEGVVPADATRWESHPLLGPARRRWRPDECAEAVRALIARGAAVERDGELLSASAAEPRQPERPVTAPLDRDALHALELIAADGVAPRAPAALAEELGCDRDRALAALDNLVDAGRAVRVKPGVYYESAVLEGLTERLLQAAADGGGEITLSQARDLLGTSRKYAQALLEHLDAEHLTVRKGDVHALRRRSFDLVGRQGSGGPPGPQSQ
jgi:selenocysteine-specific elongation factor